MPNETIVDSKATRIAEIVRKLLAVPDKLVTAQLYLRPLSHRDSVAAPTETTQPIADACDLMHSALSDVVEAARELADISSLDHGSKFHRVDVDSYYRPE
jgi:hypothetical protein